MPFHRSILGSPTFYPCCKKRFFMKSPFHYIILLILSTLIFSCDSSKKNKEAKQSSYPADGNLILDILKSRESPVVDTVLSNPEKYEVQILYTQINRDSANRPSFQKYAYGVNPNNYFYPASTVKMPIAFLALEKLNELNIEGLNKYATMLTDSAYEGQTKVSYDSTSESGKPSVAHYIKKIFLASDNDAFNRLYEFLGQAYINDKLAEKGYEDIRIVHRLAIVNNAEQNRNTNPVMFYDNAKILYQQDLVSSPNDYRYQGNILKGEGYREGDSLINQPKDFGQNNFISVANLQDMLKAVIFPEAVPAQKRFNLTEEDYQFLYQYMSQLPRETLYPNYKADTTEEYYDSYAKFFLYGDTRDSIPENIRIFNKIGMAYGYLTDNAYIVDFEQGIEFFLTAIIYVNNDQIFNDDQYEYEEIGLPFLAELGRGIFEYEIGRERKYAPDVSKFKMTYDKLEDI